MTCAPQTWTASSFWSSSASSLACLSSVRAPDMPPWRPITLLRTTVMSSNGDTNVVFRGVTHGAVDFLIKPVRVEELRNLWQHVVRKTLGAHGSQAADRTHSEEVDGDDEGRRQERKRKEAAVRASCVCVS